MITLINKYCLSWFINRVIVNNFLIKKIYKKKNFAKNQFTEINIYSLISDLI